MNNVIICGVCVGEPKEDHSIHGRKFFKMELKNKRLSGEEDYIPVIAEERIIKGNYNGKTINVYGNIKTHNIVEDGKNRLSVYLFAQKIEEEKEEIENKTNQVEFDGYICKKPTLRITPLTKKKISDFLLAVHRPTGKSDYIPCIAWGIDAQKVHKLSVGQKISVKGRFQSRKYEKDGMEKVAYEISVWDLEETE